MLKEDWGWKDVLAFAKEIFSIFLQLLKRNHVKILYATITFLGVSLIVILFVPAHDATNTPIDLDSKNAPMITIDSDTITKRQKPRVPMQYDISNVIYRTKSDSLDRNNAKVRYVNLDYDESKKHNCLTIKNECAFDIRFALAMWRWDDDYKEGHWYTSWHSVSSNMSTSFDIPHDATGYIEKGAVYLFATDDLGRYWGGENMPLSSNHSFLIDTNGSVKDADTEIPQTQTQYIENRFGEIKLSFPNEVMVYIPDYKINKLK